MGVAADLRRELQERGREILKDAATVAHQQGVEADTECVDAPLGPVGEVIVDCAQEWGADLIVIGTHGRRGIRRLVMGSDAEHVVRTATVPVLLLREAKTPAKKS